MEPQHTVAEGEDTGEVRAQGSDIAGGLHPLASQLARARLGHGRSMEGEGTGGRRSVLALF